jgi:hypothetical protein
MAILLMTLVVATPQIAKPAEQFGQRLRDPHCRAGVCSGIVKPS